MKNIYSNIISACLMQMPVALFLTGINNYYEYLEHLQVGYLFYFHSLLKFV